MANEDLLDVMVLRQLLEVDVATGRLWWKPRGEHMFSCAGQCRRWNRAYAGKLALNTIAKDGYKQGKIFNRIYYASRVVWALHTGNWPNDEIDHVDGNKANNSISNLRAASRFQNAQNRGLRKKGHSRFKGVTWNKRAKKWQAVIGAYGKKKYLGAFSLEEDAHRAYIKAAKQMHKEFAHFT